MVKYTYDSWGKVLSVDGSMADTIGEYNSLRYRGYYYDSDTGLYYLNSRYYDPVMCRFVNADGYASTGQGIQGNNMYAYCLYNPINYSDNGGTICHIHDGGRSGPECMFINGICIYHGTTECCLAEPQVPAITSPVNHADYRNDAPSAAFGSKRSGGRTHKGVDFYPSDSKNDSLYGSDGTPRNVYAMSSGTVIDYLSNFYSGTSAIVIDHGSFVALYGEISTNLKIGDTVAQGQHIGTMKVSWDNTLMLHLEIFEGGYGSYSRNNPYRVDPTYTYSLPDWR